MTIAQLLIGTIGSQVLFILTKLVFINVLNIDSVVLRIGLWLSLSIITIAIVRRMGVWNYLEAFFVTILWFIISLAVDFVITTSFTGREVYRTWYFWIAYGVIILTVIIFHKKYHVELRKMQAEHTK